jgi:hypothetical protein
MLHRAVGCRRRLNCTVVDTTPPMPLVSRLAAVDVEDARPGVRVL